MDEQAAARLLGAIVTFVQKRGSYVTKTKLLKLLYLFDVEYYRVHRKTFTGLNWKFFHLGPWAAEYDSLVAYAVATDALEQNLGKYDTPLYRATEQVETSSLGLSVKDEGILRAVLKKWSDVDTPEILDYVYFNTEPMLSGVRSQPLDFSAIQDLPPVYKRSSSGASPKEIARRRAAFIERQQKRGSEHSPVRITSPQYDESFDRAMATMDRDE